MLFYVNFVRQNVVVTVSQCQAQLKAESYEKVSVGIVPCET